MPRRHMRDFYLTSIKFAALFHLGKELCSDVLKRELSMT